MILNESQAKAVYDAMCALNNISALVQVTFPNDKDDIFFYEHQTGEVIIVSVSVGGIQKKEKYDDQNAFAKAYGMSND